MKELLALNTDAKLNAKKSKNNKKSTIDFSTLLLSNDKLDIKKVLKPQTPQIALNQKDNKTQTLKPNVSILESLLNNSSNKPKKETKNINILSNLLKDDDFKNKPFDALSKLVTNKEVQKTKEIKKSDDTSKVLLEDLSLIQLLDFVSALKEINKDVDLKEFAKLQIVKSKEDLVELSNCKHIKSLSEFAKANDLGLKKLTYEKIKNDDYDEKIFENKYPNLSKENFFTTDKIIQASLMNKKEANNTKSLDDILKNGKLNELLNSLDQNKTKTENKKDIKLENIISLDASKNQTIKTINEDAKNTINIDNELKLNEENIFKEINIKNNKSLEEKIIVKEEVKVLDKNQNNDTKQIKEVIQEQDNSKNINNKDIFSKLIQEINDEQNIKEEVKINLEEKIIDPKLNQENKLQTKEQKVENLIKEIKKDINTINQINQENINSEDISIALEQESNISPIEHKVNTPQVLKADFLSPNNNLSKDQVKTVIENFSRDFKEEVEKFKAPIHRVNISLNPKELGEVNVTMIARGNNLHVNINSNNQSTLNLFIQNQQEFKNSLVNMGFTGLNMNFNDKKEGNHKEEEKRKNKYEKIDEIEEVEEAPISITLHKYL